MDIILASVPHKPTLANGKVVIDMGKYLVHYRVDEGVKISGVFDPRNYALRGSPVYGKVVVESTNQMRMDFFKRLPRKGQRIHLFSKRGTYEVVALERDGIVITCQAWKNESSRGDRFYSYQVVPLWDFRCLYGRGTFKQAYKSLNDNSCSPLYEYLSVLYAMKSSIYAGKASTPPSVKK